MKERIHLLEDKWVCCCKCEHWLWDCYCKVNTEGKNYICPSCQNEEKNDDQINT